MKDTVEFYDRDSQHPFCTVRASLPPAKGDLVSIRGETWKVLGRSFSVDHADDFSQTAMRCNVIVERAKG